MILNKPYHSYLYGIAAVTLMSLFTGCETFQTFGKEYRENLTFYVEKAKEEQEEAKQQFNTTLEEFAALINYDGGDFEAKYKQLKNQYDQCEKRAEQVHNRIEKIESVAYKLFKEWEDELELYQNKRLKQLSTDKLRTTKVHYRDFISSMKSAEYKMYPVIAIFHDQVLFLKHNLNANAISALQDTVVSLESEVTELMQELEKAIEESNKFIDTIKEG